MTLQQLIEDMGYNTSTTQEIYNNLQNSINYENNIAIRAEYKQNQVNRVQKIMDTLVQEFPATLLVDCLQVSFSVEAAQIVNRVTSSGQHETDASLKEAYECDRLANQLRRITK